MAQIIKPIIVEVSQPNRFQALIAKQNDCNSRFLKAAFVDEGKPIDIPTNSTVTINANRLDGKSNSYYGLVNEDNTVIVPIHSWMLEVAGQVICDISIIGDDESRLTSTTFIIEVQQSANSSSSVSSDEQYDVLTELINNFPKISTTVDESSTDNEVPSAKAVVDYVHKRVWTDISNNENPVNIDELTDEGVFYAENFVTDYDYVYDNPKPHNISGYSGIVINTPYTQSEEFLGVSFGGENGWNTFTVNENRQIVIDGFYLNTGGFNNVYYRSNELLNILDKYTIDDVISEIKKNTGYDITSEELVSSFKFINDFSFIGVPQTSYDYESGTYTPKWGISQTGITFTAENATYKKRFNGTYDIQFCVSLKNTTNNDISIYNSNMYFSGLPVNIQDRIGKIVVQTSGFYNSQGNEIYPMYASEKFNDSKLEIYFKEEKIYIKANSTAYITTNFTIN